MKAFDGLTINYNYHKGEKDAPCIVLLHGIGGSITAWKNIRTILHSHGYSTLAIDLMGHGLSGRADSADRYTLENSIKDVKQVLEEEKLKKVHLVGYSYGGMVATAYATSFPDDLSSLILISVPIYYGFAYGVFSKYPVIKSLYAFFSKCMPNLGRIGQTDYDKCSGNRNIDLKRTFYDVWHITLKSYLYCWGASAQTSISSYLNKIKIPTFIISGKDDLFVSQKMAEKLAGQINNAKLKLIPGNHSMILNNAPEIVKEVVAFID